MKCILCDLEIPAGKESREHYIPKSRTRRQIWNNPRNIFWAHYMLNGIKSNYLPCEFEELKFELTYHAILNWRMPNEDREFLRRAIANWEFYNPNPCKICIAKCNQRSKE